MDYYKKDFYERTLKELVTEMKGVNVYKISFMVPGIPHPTSFQL